MSAPDELYNALREMEVPAERAQAIVNSLEAAKNKTDVRDALENMPAFTSLGEPELERFRDELLDLMLQHAMRRPS